ncbi:hypothetical protein [Nocardioides speluncae]|uniref:hypothetical protein n=1 Tax=Nocardioides speluncae TaxID=2670337 RepID=UPI000D695ADB|nr:hypothetical protein [Nocardioides speluncae]
MTALAVREQAVVWRAAELVLPQRECDELGRDGLLRRLRVGSPVSSRREIDVVGVVVGDVGRRAG